MRDDTFSARNRTADIWNDDDGAEAASRTEAASHRRHSALRGFAVFFLTLTAVLAVVVFAAYRDGTGFDVLRRYFNYGAAESAGGTVVYDYDVSSANRFAVLGENLAVLSETSFSVLDAQGGQVWSTGVKMACPALQSGGGRAVGYDVGGTELYIVDEKGAVMTLTLSESEPIISARLNEKGWLAVTTGKKNSKGWVGVYNDRNTLVFEFKSSRRFVADAYVTDDCARLAAVTLGQENSTFVSNIVLYNLTEDQPFADYDITDGLVAAIGQDGQTLITVSDTCLTFASTDGKIVAEHPYGGAYLREYALGGSGFTALLLNRYSSGSVGRLVTVGDEGDVLGTLDINEEVLNLSAAGRYLAVLYASRLVIYNENLQVYAALNGTDYARTVLMRPDGSALLAGSESAELFLP